MNTSSSSDDGSSYYHFPLIWFYYYGWCLLAPAALHVIIVSPGFLETMAQLGKPFCCLKIFNDPVVLFQDMFEQGGHVSLIDFW